MKDINDKIRSSIAKSYRLRELALDRKITRKKSFELHQMAHENDEKIKFYKNLSNALKEVGKSENN